MNHAYIVLLAVGTALSHDTGRRMEIEVIAPSTLDAAVIGETHGKCMVSDVEYVHAKSVRLVRGGRFSLGLKPELAMAI